MDLMSADVLVKLNRTLVTLHLLFLALLHIVSYVLFVVAYYRNVFITGNIVISEQHAQVFCGVVDER